MMDMTGKRVLITGGMGMIGSGIAHAAVALGAAVTILDSMMEGTGANCANIKGIEKDVRVIKGDIRDDAALAEAVPDQDIIYNCAAQVSHMLSMTDPFLDIDINCNGHLALLECVRRHNDSARVIYTGTRSQFGTTARVPIGEDCPDNPADIYSANKLASELYHLNYHVAYGIHTTSVRMTNTYGPRGQISNPSYSVVNWLIGRAVAGHDLTIYEPGTQLRDLNYVDDAIEALMMCGESNKSKGEVFVLGTGVGVTLRELGERIVSIAGNGQVRIVPWPAERKAIEAGDIVMDISKIQRLLGWRPKTGVDDGIQKTIGFYRKNWEDYHG